MAVSFKTDANYGYTLMPLFGVNENIILAAKNCGVKIEQGSPGTFLIKSEGMVHASIKVQGQAISLAKSGALGPSNKNALKIQFEGGLAKACSASHAVMQTPPAKAVSIAQGFDAAGEEPTGPNPMHEKVGKPMPWKQAVKLDSYGNIVPAGKAMTTPGAHLKPKPAPSPEGALFQVAPAPVGSQSLHSIAALVDATKVYQPTKGSTSGSVYYVFAMFNGLNLSARYKNSRLSIRAEGAGIASSPTQVMALKDFGMDHNGTYMSGHYECVNIAMVQKALGAVISRIGFQHVLSVADISTLLESAA